MRERAKEFADKISTSKKKEITLISHIDADGITSMSIMVRVLKRAKIRFKGIFLRQLDERTVEKIPGDSSLKLFLDLGSGQQDILEVRGFKREEVLIIDHHIPGENIYEQFNPLLFQREEKKVSAAGLAYLVAKNIGENSDLSKLAIVGAVGDMMANETNRLEGSMREIVNDARRKGFLKVTKDISAYGISTRPIHLMLSYTDDPYMDGLTDNKDNCLDLLKDLGIAAKEDERWRVWEDLSREEKRRIYSELIEKVKEEDQYRLSGENYIFKDERRRTPLRNAKEYSTLLNACGRWVKPKIGMDVCLGDRDERYGQASVLLKNHKRVIRELLEYILKNGVIKRENIQYMDAKDNFPDTIIGIGAGMARSKLDKEIPGKPMIIFGDMVGEEDLRKVSGRANYEQVKRGINLQEAISRASQAVGGGGGGHKIAAGGCIPRGTEEAFLNGLDEIVGEQTAK